MTTRKLPMQPIVLDAQGRACFMQNSVVKHLLEQSGLDLWQALSGGHPPADKVQFLQLLGLTVEQFCKHTIDEATLQQVQMEAERVTRQGRPSLAWVCIETGWYSCYWRGKLFELRLMRASCRGTYRLDGRKAMRLPWLEHSDPATGVHNLSWVATQDKVPIPFSNGGSVTGMVSSLAEGKRRVYWLVRDLPGES